MEHRLVHFAADKALSKILKYIDKAPEENLLKILRRVQALLFLYEFSIVY